MARALLGHVSGAPSAREHLLALEVARLRRRVAELESEVEQAHEHRTLELELHEFAGATEPALA